jgi:hypothetical protein
VSATLVLEIAIHPDAAGPDAQTAERAYDRITEALAEQAADLTDARITPLEPWGGGEWRTYGYASSEATDGVYVSVRRWERVTVEELILLLEPVD